MFYCDCTAVACYECISEAKILRQFAVELEAMFTECGDIPDAIAPRAGDGISELQTRFHDQAGILTHFL